MEPADAETEQCDGRRPCSNCTSKGVACTSAKPSTGVKFVEHSTREGLGRVLVQDSWRFTNIFYQTLGSLPIVSMLQFDSVGAMSQQDPHVNRTLAIIGGIFAYRNPHLLRLTPQEKRSVVESWAKQKAVIISELKTPTKKRFSAILTCALVLSIAEVCFPAPSRRFLKLTYGSC